MANKKFRRMITGILLSCNLISFPFCLAYDVLTETVANQSGSEQLKALYTIGVNEMQRPYAEKRERLRNERQSELNELDDQINTCKELQRYYQNLFKDCCEPQKLKELRDELVNSLTQDEVVLDCYTTRAKFRPCKETKEYREYLDELCRPLMTKLLLNNPKYHFVYIVNFLEFSDFKQVGFANEIRKMIPDKICSLSLQALWNFKNTLTNQPKTQITEQIAKEELKNIKQIIENKGIPLEKLTSKQENDLKTKILPTKIREQFFSTANIPKKKTWEAVTSAFLKKFSDKIQSFLQKALKSFESKKQAIHIETKIRSLKTSQARIANNPDAVRRLVCSRFGSKTTAIGPVQAYSIFTSLRDFTEGGRVTRGNGNVMFSLTPDLLQIKILAENEHLSAHFEPKTSIESSTEKRYYGKFDVENSIFFSENKTKNVGELLDLPLTGNKTVIISAYKTGHPDKENRNNYVFYIYDYDKYGFAKTGEVYDSVENKWKPAYAIMFVTNEKHELVTTYPLYM